MASRKLNVLLYVFTGKAETCRMVHQGSVSNRKVLYSVCVQDVRLSGSHSDMHTKLEDISHDIYQKTQQNKTLNGTITEHYQLI